MVVMEMKYDKKQFYCQKNGKLSTLIIIYLFEYVSHLTLTSSVNIGRLCVVEWRVEVSSGGPATELIFPHAGRVELVTVKKTSTNSMRLQSK